MRRVTSQTKIDAPRQRVWELLADLEAVQDYNPGVVRARLTSDRGHGVGAARHCDLNPKGWVEEEVSDWDEGQSYTIEIVDSNLPIATATGQFFFEEADGDGTLVTVNFDYEVKYGVLGRLLDRIATSRQFDRAIPGILGGAKRFIEEGDRNEAPA